MTRIFLPHSGVASSIFQGSFPDPGNWNPRDNKIECIGAGGRGRNVAMIALDSLGGGGGGGGGGYAFDSNLAPSFPVPYAVTGGNILGGFYTTQWNTDTLGSGEPPRQRGNVWAQTGFSGGQDTAGSLGGTFYPEGFSGGNGGNGGGGAAFGGGGGGGGAGPEGPGSVGGNASTGITPGTGGMGNGGTVAATTAANQTGNRGGGWEPFWTIGGGASGSNVATPAPGAGGLFGGGGGGPRDPGTMSFGMPGIGGSGLIVVTYHDPNLLRVGIVRGRTTGSVYATIKPTSDNRELDNPAWLKIVRRANEDLQMLRVLRSTYDTWTSYEQLLDWAASQP